MFHRSQSSFVLIVWFSQGVMAAKGIYIPLFTYKTGPFAGSGIPTGNGMADYLTMLNERDGGIGGGEGGGSIGARRRRARRFERETRGGGRRRWTRERGERSRVGRERRYATMERERGEDCE